MAGGLMQLVAYGAQDIYLTGNPQITFFKVVYRRHTNFSMECIKQSISGQSFIGTSNVNNKATVNISRNGDLVTGIYVICDQSTVDGICGDHLVEDVEIEIGGQRIDKHYREWNQIWSELTTPVSKSEGFKYMTGGFSNNLVSGGSTYGTNQQSIQYPLNFWFCRNPGLALPLIALQYHEVQLKITWGIGYYNSSTNENLTRRNQTLSTAHQLEVWADYIYLDTDERRRFSQVSHEYLIEQLQIQKEKDVSNTTFKLNLEHPVKELIWTTPTDSPMTDQKIRLEINGHDRFSERDKEYFTLTQPFNHHTSIPGYNIKETDKPQYIDPIKLSIETHDNRESAGSSSVSLGNTSTPGSNYNGPNETIIKFKEAFLDVPKIGDILHIALGSEHGPTYSTDVMLPTFQTVTAVSSDTDPIVTIYPGISPKQIPPGYTDYDGISITIVGRTQNPQSRCSQLKKDIYVYSFSLEPEEHQPSGTCNFSRIDSAKLILSSTSKISNIYAVNYNVLRIMSGMAGLAYSS